MNGKILSVSSLLLSALISCENGMSAGSAGTSQYAGTSMAARESGRKNEKPAGAYFKEEKKSGSRTVKPEYTENISWMPEDEIIRLKDNTAEVTVSGLKAGDELYLIRANPSGKTVPAEYAQYIRSVRNITGNTGESGLYENVRRLYTGAELKFSDPKRADPWEVPDKKTMKSGKT